MAALEAACATSRSAARGTTLVVFDGYNDLYTTWWTSSNGSGGGGGGDGMVLLGGSDHGGAQATRQPEVAAAHAYRGC